MSAADVLFTGAAVFTGTGRPIQGHAVAVTGDRITAVVPEAEAQALIGEGTQVVQLDGALLSPGFQDAHVHPIGAGVELLMCNLTESESAEEAVATVKAYADANPDEAWILGGGWSMDQYPGGAPVRALLDAVVPDRPVVLSSRDHHSVWANTAAITLAGLDASTPDPVDGRIEREADGFPAGTFHEGAEHLFNHVRPGVEADFAYAGLLRAQDELLALGITGWQDAMVGTLSGIEDIDAIYRRAVAEGTLRVHVVGAQWWERDGGIEQVERMIARRDELVAAGTTARYSLGTTKIMVDGVAENQTAAMLAPYRDSHGHDTDNSGLSFVDPAFLKQVVTELDAAGMQVHFHALGDRAVREALDAIEAARAANGPTDGRHHLAHLQVVEESETARFAPSTRSRTCRRSGRRTRTRSTNSPFPSCRTAPRPASTRSATSSATGPASRRAATGPCRAPTRWTRSTSPSPVSRPASTPSPSAASTSDSISRRRWRRTPPAPPT